ncbi:uncharacterized protein LOC128220405 [Mya arenaria]|uniref:uncharacterized protein LOC128220405 n=1 Tax=Mya arenaria TaxID=6604 RepID=UPI0022E38F9A|nr:uncharacterized protein LOC128220405 [Mya arenaria]XP_052784742.1 uncharacterized protein LOC128220405 [Mya arenaria]XP_052784743.1 uncharacterized protein LOC128220405 [Mya arenaria]
MMSRYSDGHGLEYSSRSPSSPRGRRYVLKNLNYKKRKQITLDKSRNEEYFDLRKVQTSRDSVNTYQSLSKPVGTSNKVMPTESPRKQPVYVSPRKDVRAEVASKKQADDKKTPRKGDTKTDSNAVSSRKNEHGLTPRDEYMVTKLYDREIIYLKPSEVRYTHDQIPAHFQDGRSMISSFIALLYGRVEIRLGGKDIPPIEVMQTEEMESGRSGKLWYVVNGNRRLFVFRRLEKCGALSTMQVVTRKYDAIEMDKHFLTRNHGRAISITNDAGISAKIAKEVAKWKEWKAKQPKQNDVKGRKGKGPNKGANKGRKQGPSEGVPGAKSSCCVIS